jgi:ribosomal protein S18 acetylase RimI-like enzyme
MTLEIIPFQPDHIPQAGRLLAARHRQDRRVHPALPARFEDGATAEAAVAAAWQRPHAAGVVARRDGQMLGYLISDLLLDEVWSRSAWVRLAGWALAAEAGWDLIGDMYSALGPRWLDYGCFTHFAQVSTAAPALVQTWFMLGFGVEQIEALADLTTLVLPPPRPVPDLQIRQAEASEADRQVLRQIAPLIRRQLEYAPAWAVSLPETEEQNRADYAELVDDPTVTTWLAFRHGAVMGSQAYYEPDNGPDTLLVPPSCTYLTAVATVPEARGQGIAGALTRQGLAHSQAAGYHYCSTNWRSANLPIARFLPPWGFETVAYRLVRRLDPRIAWARAGAT